MKNLNQNLRTLLNTANISENELSRRTGVAQQIINRMLSGENQNPKIETLRPLANYFMVSLSQLIGDERFQWQEIPLLAWKDISYLLLNQKISETQQHLLLDIQPAPDIFAVKMDGDSMEPKFSHGALLIFDPHKKPTNGDFVLIQLPQHDTLLRQIFIHHENSYQKCLNPSHVDYELKLLNKDVTYLGLLIQSRTDFVGTNTR